jgi:uncharacterized protein YcfJ
MRGQAFVAATALAAALMGVQPANAQQYPTYQDAHVAQAQCQDAQRNRTVGGAIIGGIAGAILGHNVAGGHGSRDEGTALGAVVGAGAGGLIGHNMNGQCAAPEAGAYDPYYGQAQPNDQYAQDDQYNQNDDLYGAPNDDPYSKSDEDDGAYGSK